MKCLVAVESGTAKIIVSELKKAYSDWDYETCSNAEDLAYLAGERPEVLMISRFLPNSVDILSHIPLMFPATHIVLLAGVMNEQAKAYVRMAEKIGLVNIVTGKLPGELSYNIFTAMTNDKHGLTVIEQPCDVGGPVDNAAENENLKADNPVNTIDLTFPPESPVMGRVKDGDERRLTTQDITPRELPHRGYDETSFPERKRDSSQTKDKVVDEESLKKKRPAKYYSKGDISVYSKTMQKQYGRDRKDLAPVVASVANKGGVGKTTTAITISVALAKAGLKTVLVDIDFGGSNITSFFNINPAKGVEILSGRKDKNLLPVIGQLLLKTKYKNLKILPGPADKTIFPEDLFEYGELARVIGAVRELCDVVIVDTPPEFWTKPWMEEVLEISDIALAVVDQSIFSEDDTREYAPKLISMGITPEKIKIVLNKFSPRLHNARIVEKAFCEGFKKGIDSHKLPKVAATIPNDWDVHNLKSYKVEVVGLEDAKSQWHKLAEEIAKLAGYNYKCTSTTKPKRGLFPLLKGR